MLSPVQSQTENAGRFSPAQSQGLSDGADFSTFLRMLTTQMQNQNPLNPVEAADFAVQLATFSGVEQQVHTNQLLARLTERLVTADLANWLGADVAARGDVRVGSDAVSLHLPAPVAGTARRDVVISTLSGQEILRLPVALDQNFMTLDPRPDGASPLLPGAYQTQVHDFAENELLQTHAAPQFAPVMEVRQGPSGTMLVLASGVSVDPTAIVAIRKP